MIPYHIHADLASERRSTLLAEAEAFRLAKQARSYRQRAGTCAGRRGRAEPRGRAAQNLAAGQAREPRKYAAALRRSGMARRSQAGTPAGAALLRVISRPVRGKAGRAAGGQAGQTETGQRRWAVLAVVSAAQFLTVLDLWVVNIALPALQHDFAPATLSDVSWILDVYAIVLAALLLPAGRAADSIGRRKCFLAGLVVFGVASLGCAVAPDLPALIACRALQAAGAAVLMPTSLGLALSVFPSHQRGTAVGVWAGVGAVAAGSGPVLGGLLVESSWRWIFLINLPVILATLAAGVAILPPRGNMRGNIHAGERGSRRTGWRTRPAQLTPAARRPLASQARRANATALAVPRPEPMTLLWAWTSALPARLTRVYLVACPTRAVGGACSLLAMPAGRGGAATSRVPATRRRTPRGPRAAAGCR